MAKRRIQGRTFGWGMQGVARVLLATMPFLGLPDMALALPHGGIVSKGAATLGYSTNSLLIHQTTNSATFNWSSYVVKSGQTVTYQTPGASSVSLNMVGGTSPTQIMGSVKSNGILEFMNSNGIVFGQGSTVSAAGVMAFGSTNPWGIPTGSVSNAGTITVSQGGTVALVGTNVTNTGTINAPGGTIVLAAGSSVVPIYSGSSSSLAGVVTTGSGGVLDSGVISAETVGSQTGKIVLQGGMGTGYVSLQPAAVIDASAPNGGNGGAVVINGSEVVLDNTTPINVTAPLGTPGTISIDPSLVLSGTTIDVCNATGLTTIDRSQTSLTIGTTSTDPLTDTIVLEGNMNLGGATWIPLGNSTNNFTGTFNGNNDTISNYTISATSNDTGFIGLLGSGGTLENVTLSGTVSAGSASSVGGAVGYNVGTVQHVVNEGNVSAGGSVGGVMGYNDGGTVSYSSNVGTVTGSSTAVGGVVGYNANGSSTGLIEYSYNTGAVHGGSNNYVGGVVGSSCGTVKYSFNTGTVSGDEYVGGDVGYTSGTVEYSYNTGSVSGVSSAGGVVGNNTSAGTVEYSYNTGSVSVTGTDVGGGVGYNSGVVKYFYNTGNVSSSTGYFVGGVVGDNLSGSTVEYSYSIGSVNTTAFTGGIAGYNTGTVIDTYYDSTVSLVSGIGGGTNSGSQTVSGVVYAENTSSFGSATTMGNLGAFASNWNGTGFSTNNSGPWLMSGANDVSYNNNGTVSTMTAPILVGDLPVDTITGSGTSVYNGSAVVQPYTVSSTMGGAGSPSGVTITSNMTTDINAGSYHDCPGTTGTLASPTNQRSYGSVTTASGTWTITPLAVTATAINQVVTQGSSIPALSGSLTFSGSNNGITNLSTTWITPATPSSPAGSYAINPSYSYLNGAVAGDFTITAAASNATALTVVAAQGGGSGGSSSGGSPGASSTISPATSNDTISTKTFVPEVQTVEPLMVTPALSIPATVAAPTPSALSPAGSSTIVDVASGGSWSLGVSLPATPLAMTTDLVSAEPMEQVTAPTGSGTTGSSSLTQQKQQ